MAILLALLVAGPWLLPGYLFGTDWPGPSHFSVPMDFSSGTIFDAVLVVVSAVVSAELTTKLVILVALIAAAGGAFRAVPIGGLRMIDGQEADDKIIAVLESDVAYGHFQDIKDCPKGLIDRLKHYFLSYKQLPGDAPRRVEIADVYDRTEAIEVIERSLRDYRARYGAPEERVSELRRLLTDS